PPTPQTSPLSLHDALPISERLADGYVNRTRHPTKDLKRCGWGRLPEHLGFRDKKTGVETQRPDRSAIAKSKPERQVQMRKPKCLDRKSTRLNSSHDQISYA